MEHPFALKSNNDTAETLIHWEAPPAGWALLNTDRAAKGDPGVAAGGGGILQGDQGEWIKGFAKNFGGVYSGQGGAQSGAPWLENGKDFGVEEDLAPSGFNDCGWHAPGQWVLGPHPQAAYYTIQKLNGANRLKNQGDALLQGGKQGSGQIGKFRYY